ncbi:MAG: ATP-binding cassette domain-containing protein [Bacteroidetes bacterium]|jgi:putative ABC transport system ATP-binding protein|nr:ATP-binding cassette domain-containing protein [Bacteroidota bacterium]
MLSLRKAVHQYSGGTSVQLPDLEFERGDQLLVTGLSGSGKSTLLHVLAGILRPTTGEYRIDGKDPYQMSESQRDRFRGQSIGIVYQQLHLIDTLAVVDNLKLARYMAGLAADHEYILELCSDLDIGHLWNSYPHQLSQGQKQRVAIARALVNSPALLLADEPTSSLDDVRAESVIGLLKMQAEKSGSTLIVSTHDQRVKRHFSNQVEVNAKKMKEA